MRWGGIDLGRAARRAGMAAAAGLSLAACATSRMAPVSSGPWGVKGTMKPYAVGGVRYVPREQPGYDAVGLASWYAEGSPHRRTADGEVFDAGLASAAHTTLPLPCWVDVTNLDNGRRARLRVNDRGPFARGRILDVSRRAAQELGFLDRGMARVRVRYVGPAGPAGSGPPGPRLAAALAPISPPDAPPPAIRDGWTARTRIQAGAFASLEGARRAAASLVGEGVASIEPVERGEATLYRVMVVCPDGADPAVVLAHIAAAGFVGARLIAAS